MSVYQEMMSRVRLKEAQAEVAFLVVRRGGRAEGLGDCRETPPQEL